MRVVIAADEALLRRGLELVLQDGGHEVVAAVADATELTDAVTRVNPDLVVTDIRMPPTHTDEGLTAALRIRRELPGTPVVVLSQHVQRRYARDLLAEGAEGVGYQLKQRIADVGTFLDDLARVADGGTALDPDVVEVMVGRARHSEAAVSGLTLASRRCSPSSPRGAATRASPRSCSSPRRPSCSTSRASTTHSGSRMTPTPTGACRP